MAHGINVVTGPTPQKTVQGMSLALIQEAPCCTRHCQRPGRGVWFVVWMMGMQLWVMGMWVGRCRWWGSQLPALCVGLDIFLHALEWGYTAKAPPPSHWCTFANELLTKGDGASEKSTPPMF